jgi:tetratricopeptide (TPR) repeat protein
MVFALMIALGACTRSPGPDRRGDEAAMAVLGVARALHHEADVYESSGDFERATQAMQRVLALQLPAEFAEAEDVRADASGRLAELLLRRTRPDEALTEIERALREAPHESVLQARLYMVRGQAHRMLAERASTASDAATATRHREAALTALEHSIEVNTRILRRLTDAGRAP